MRGTLAMLAIEAKLPTICEWKSMAAEGCLVGYGPDFAGLLRSHGGLRGPHLPWRRAGRVTDRGADTLRVRH